jgi:hypothetical protein
MVDLLGRLVGVLAELGISDLSQKSDGTLLQLAGQIGPDVRDGDG